jgi:hypothetical protein
MELLNAPLIPTSPEISEQDADIIDFDGLSGPLFGIFDDLYTTAQQFEADVADIDTGIAELFTDETTTINVAPALDGSDHGDSESKFLSNMSDETYEKLLRGELVPDFSKASMYRLRTSPNDKSMLQLKICRNGQFYFVDLPRKSIRTMEYYSNMIRDWSKASQSLELPLFITHHLRKYFSIHVGSDIEVIRAAWKSVIPQERKERKSGNTVLSLNALKHLLGHLAQKDQHQMEMQRLHHSERVNHQRENHEERKLVQIQNHGERKLSHEERKLIQNQNHELQMAMLNRIPVADPAAVGPIRKAVTEKKRRYSNRRRHCSASVSPSTDNEKSVWGINARKNAPSSPRFG